MRILGIHIEGSWIRVAILEQERKELKIKHLKTFATADSQNVKELYIPAAPHRIASGVSSVKSLVRETELSLPKTSHVEEALLFQSEASTHFNPKEILTVPQVLSHEGGKIHALLHTVSKEALKECLVELDALGVDPDGLSTVPLGLFAFSRWRHPEIKNAFLIHLGFHEWTCVWMEKGRLKKVHAFPGGNESLLLALWEDRKKILLHKEVDGVAKQIDLLQLKSHLNPHLSRRLKEMRQDLTKAIFSFHRESGTIPCFFTGCIDTFVHFQEFLTETMKEALSSEICGKATIEELKHAIPIGWALEQFQTPLQLRRGEFFPRKNWKKAGLYALSLIMSSFLLSAVLLFAGKRCLADRLASMTKELETVLDMTDSEFKERLFAQEGDHPLEKWIEAVETHSKECPYIIKAPNASEVLVWLSSHPLFKKFKKEGTPITIQHLRYQLVQHPKMGALGEPYRAKVEIEFIAQSPLDARKFHQALLKGDEWVDAQEEIGWETLAEGYRAHFYLKNKTIAPSFYVP